MKKITIITCFILILTMMFSFVYGDVNYNDKAEYLKKLGLFKGSDKGFELERAPKRIESAVMLVRLLGKEEEVIDGTYNHPFTDVPKWGDNYIGYMYEKGLTKGKSDKLFGSSDLTDAKSYATFVLRSLGYDDYNGDFSWTSAIDMAVDKGILGLDEGDRLKNVVFLRDDMVNMSYNALYTNSKNTTKTLIKSLQEQGVLLTNLYAKTALTNITDSLIINDKEIKYNGYIIDMNNENIKVKTALAKNSVGSVDMLSNIAVENNAILAINGSFFSAYDKNSETKDPYGILVVDGNVVHNMNDRATIGFSNGKVDIDRVDTQIKGSNGKPDYKYGWYGYFINHTAVQNGVNINIYNSFRGKDTLSYFGKNYIVEDGHITKIVENESVAIPDNGFVVNLNGILGDSPKAIYKRFDIGYPCSYDVTFTPSNSSNKKFWNNLDYATGAGPALIIDGNIDLQYSAEHFTEEKIISYSAARSAIGYTKNNKLIFITTTCTIDELAQIMLNLNCYEAMNLDGGASSGLWYDGKYIREPGRDISNIIYVE